MKLSKGATIDEKLQLEIKEIGTALNKTGVNIDQIDIGDLDVDSGSDAYSSSEEEFFPVQREEQQSVMPQGEAPPESRAGPVIKKEDSTGHDQTAASRDQLALLLQR